MSYRIEIERPALKALGKLDPSIRRRVQATIDRLADEPHPSGCRKLTGHGNTWRIKAARDWRVLYEIHNGILTVLLVEVAHRREAYRDR